MKKIHTCPRYTAGLAAVYRKSRVVSRPRRAGAGGSGHGAANRSYRAVYRALAAVYRQRRRERRAGAADRGRESCGRGDWKRVESRGVSQPRLLGHPGHLGFMGLNGPAHEFSFSFFFTSKPRNKYQMHSKLKTFNTTRLYKSWTIF
jgi:hypothetical protein